MGRLRSLATAGAPSALLHMRWCIISCSAAAHAGSVCRNAAPGSALLHVSDLPDPLVWVFIALLWFVLKGESSSAWQFLSLLTSVAFFAVSQKFRSLKQLVGTCQVLHLQECVLSPLSFLSHHRSEFICHPRRGGTQRHPRFALLSARGAALVQHGGAATRSLTWRSWSLSRSQAWVCGPASLPQLGVQEGRAASC